MSLRKQISALVLVVGAALAGCVPVNSVESASGRGQAGDSKQASKVAEPDEDVARDASQPLSERFETEWFDKKLSQPRFFSRHLVEKHRHDVPSLRVKQHIQMTLPAYRAEALLATSAGIYLATCLQDCHPYSAGANEPLPTDLVLVEPERDQIRKIVDTGDAAWSIIHIFPYGAKGIGWAEAMNVERGNGDDSMWTPWRIKACQDINNCRPQILYEENSGQTALECNPHSVHGRQLLCWYSVNTDKEGYPEGTFSLLHLDMSQNPVKSETLITDSPSAYDFVWQKSGDMVFVGQWGCKEFACKGDTPKTIRNHAVEFRQTSFTDFPKNKVIKALDHSITPTIAFIYGNGKYVTWGEGNPNPFLIGYSAVRKYLDLETGGPIRVLGEDSTLVFADASEKYLVFFSSPASKLYLVNPRDNTAIVLQDDGDPKAEDAASLANGQFAISGDYVAWINNKFATRSVSLRDAMENYQAVLHVAKIAPASS